MTSLCTKWRDLNISLHIHLNLITLVIKYQITSRDLVYCGRIPTFQRPNAVSWTYTFALFPSSRRGLGIFLFTTAFRTVLGPTQPPIQGLFPLRVKRMGREADHSPPPSAEMKECVELYLHSPDRPSWLGTRLSTGTTLPFTSPWRLWQHGPPKRWFPITILHDITT
jgi:hypothetical protein